MMLVLLFFSFFFFNDTATTEIYTLSLHDALPIWAGGGAHAQRPRHRDRSAHRGGLLDRSEEHTSELQSHLNLVCRLLLEKKKKKKKTLNERRHKEGGNSIHGDGCHEHHYRDKYCA